MKYKVGDRVRIIDCTCGHKFEIGDEVEIIEVNDIDYKAASATDYWYVNDDEIEPIDMPDYRALYEQEKALRGAAERYIQESPCDPDIYPEQMASWEHYQQLKQQYNGTSNTSNN